LSLDKAAIQQLSSQIIEEDGAKVRLYSGRIARGRLQGARVLLKAYPPPYAQSDVDALAANELRAHARLQPPEVKEEGQYVAKLLGGLTVSNGASKGEQWLLFRNDGIITAAEYAARAAQATQKGQTVGEGEFWDRFNTRAPLKRRKIFIMKVC
jgi:hypothetical protein